MRYLSPVVLLALAACGGGGGSPSSPSTPQIAQVAGLWRVTATLSSVSGGECAGPFLQALIGTPSGVSRSSVSITQNGATLTATSTSDSNGSTCQYTGNAGANTFTLNWQSCQIGVFRLTCANGAVRDINLVSNSATMTVTGSSGTGTQAESYNVFVAGTNVGVGVLVANSNISATRQ